MPVRLLCQYCGRLNIVKYLGGRGSPGPSTLGEESITAKELKSEASQSSLAISAARNKVMVATIEEAKRRFGLVVSSEIC